jgi:hypothetical protein
MFELIPFLALAVAAVTGTFVLVARDGYRRIPRRY